MKRTRRKRKEKGERRENERSQEEKTDGKNKIEGKSVVTKLLTKNRRVTNLTASGELTVPGSWSLCVPRAHLHLPPELSTSHVIVKNI